MSPRVINDKGRELLKRFEGCRLEAYNDGTGVWTIGYGHTQGVEPGMTITQEQADDLLEHDLMKFEAAIDRLAPSTNANEFSACVCLAFNIGVSAFEASSLLRKIKAGDWLTAPEEFLRWCRAGGKVMPGLVRRRRAERDLFLEPVN